MWHTMLCNDMDVPVVWKGNKEPEFTLAPPGMCPSRLWVSGWVWIWENKKHKVYRIHMAYALAISYSMSGMQLANIRGVYHSRLKTLWVQGNRVNALWALNGLSPFFLLLWKCFSKRLFFSLIVQIYFVLFLMPGKGQWFFIHNRSMALSDNVCAVGFLGKQMIQLANKFYGKLHKNNLSEFEPKSYSQGKSTKLP